MNRLLIVCVLVVSGWLMMTSEGVSVANPWGYNAGEAICVTTPSGVWLRELPQSRSGSVAETPVVTTALLGDTLYFWNYVNSVFDPQRRGTQYIEVSQSSTGPHYLATAGLAGIPQRQMGGSCSQDNIAGFCDVTQALATVGLFTSADISLIRCYATTVTRRTRSVTFSLGTKDQPMNLTSFETTYWGAFSLPDQSVCGKDLPAGLCGVLCSDLFDLTVSANCLATLQANEMPIYQALLAQYAWAMSQTPGIIQACLLLKMTC